ncbi:hypothetical protein Avbf_10821 [Armadillidium vulgare]|nr:hypothetical protein Avbf_10821 [Armadillidium vulgare]
MNLVLWGECKFFWPKCYDVKSNDICSFLNVTSEVPLHPRKCYEYMISSSRYYWQEQVLRLQELSDVGRIGKIHWDLTLCVAFIWLATFIFLAKGIKSSRKNILVYRIRSYLYLSHDHGLQRS